MTRVLLLRSARPWAHLVMALAVGGFFLTARGAPWRGEWQWTFDWVAGASILLGPLLAGAVAYEASTGRDFDLHLVRPGSRHRLLATVAPALGPVAAMTAPYVVLVLVGAVLTAVRSPTDVFVPVLPVLGLLCLAVFAVAGLLLGHRLPPVPAALVAWGAGLTANIALAGVGLPTLLRVGGASASLAGSRLDLRAVFLHLAFFLGLAAVGLVLARGRPAGRPPRAALGVVGAVTLLAGLLLAPDANLYRADPTAATHCGRAGGVRVCMLAGNTSQLGAWAEGLDELRSRVEQPWLTVTDYRQPTFGRQLPAGTGVLLVDPQRVNIAAPTEGSLSATLARPSDCPQYYADRPPTGALDAAHWLAEWFSTRAGRAGGAGDPVVSHWVDTAPAARQESWARATYDALRTCRLDDARVPA